MDSHRTRKHTRVLGLIWTTPDLDPPKVVASMAEMASMSPSAGGQYQWVSEFAPPSMQKILSYISGWLAALGWQAFIASSAYQTGNVILILASMNNPSYVPTVW
jgi:choline transport protein